MSTEQQIIFNTSPVALIPCAKCSLTIFAIGENGLCEACALIEEAGENSGTSDPLASVKAFLRHGSADEIKARLSALRVGGSFKTDLNITVERKTAHKYRLRWPGQRYSEKLMELDEIVGHLG